MNSWQMFVNGFDPDHMPALYGGIVYAIGWAIYWYVRRPVSKAPIADQVAGHLLADSAAIHLALPIGHHDDPVLTFLFLASGVAYGVLGWRAIVGGRYRAPSILLVVATLIAYIYVVGTGGEGADQVGIITAIIEVVTLGICLVPRGHAPVRRAFGSAAFVLSVILAGGGMWIASFAGHDATPTAAAATSGHNHEADRGQAGMIMQPTSDDPPTPDQVRAANAIAAETRTATLRYTDIRAALAAGYRPSLQDTGLRVHLENKANGKDGRYLDPKRPEMLMYAIDGGKATLLGAVFQMPRAGMAGPTPGGSIMQWHVHDVCLTAIPPSYSVLDAYGTCPMFSLSLTSGAMMHVWVIDHPGGPYNDDSPDSWIRAYNQAHGEPFTW